MHLYERATPGPPLSAHGGGYIGQLNAPVIDNQSNWHHNTQRLV